MTRFRSKSTPHKTDYSTRQPKFVTKSISKIGRNSYCCQEPWFRRFCVCETWLGDQYKNNDVSIPGYNIFRKDRSDTKGGGVSLYVKDHFVVKTRNDLMFDEVEAIWLELNQGGQRNCLISCIDRPPSSSQKYNSKIVDMYEKAQLDDFPIISMGDLNYDYKLDESFSNNPIYYIGMAYDLKQLIVQPTWETIETWTTTLDIILVSHPDLHKKNKVMKYNFSDHYLVYPELELNHNNVKKVNHNNPTEKEVEPLGNPRCNETYVWTRPCACQSNEDQRWQSLQPLSVSQKSCNESDTRK